jgi:hypothetical protein
MIIHSPIISGSLTFADGGTLTLPNPTSVTGTFTGTVNSTNGVVSGSSQITLSSTTGYNANEHFTQGNITTVGTVTSGDVTSILPSGILSSSAQVDGTSISSNNINIGGVSISLGGNDATPALNLSDATNYTGDSNLVTVGTVTSGNVDAILPDGVVSGSAQISVTNSIVASNAAIASSKINYNGTGIVSGSGQIALSGVTGDSDDITEGSTNTFFTNARARGAISVSGDLSYNSGTGVISFTNDAGDIEGVTAGNGLTGGGTTGTVTVNVGAGDGISVAADSVAVDATVLRTTGDGVVSGSAQIDIHSTDGYVANEHIDHSGVTLTAGNGLTGGGTIAASRTFAVGQGDGISVAADTVAVDGTVLRTTGDGVVSGSSQITHDSTTGFVANEHINHSSVSITAGNGLTGGGTIAATRTINVGAGDGITANANDIAVDATVLRTTGFGVVSGSSQINGQSVASPAAIYDNSGTPALRSGITAAEVRTLIGAEADGTDNSTDVTLAGSYDYLTISGQVITLGQVDASTDISNLTTSNVSEGSNKYATTANVKTALNANLGTLTIGDSNDEITIPGNLTVTGTTTTNNVETVSTSNGVIFEGNVADANELTLLAGTVSADRTVTLPDATGTVALTSDIPTNNNQLSNGAGYITSFDITEQTDPKYLRSNATDTASGIITFSNSTASTSKTTGAVIVTGGVGISGALNVGGDVVAYASSDERLKDNIELISNPIEKVQSLKGVTWNWNENADELQQSLPNVGVIAQDVEKVLPQLVTDRDNGFKGVDYAKLTGLLIEAIKDQQKQIDELKSKLS